MRNWTQPTPEELKIAVRDLILRHPDRHNQKLWVDSAFGNFTTGATDRIVRLLRRRRSIPSLPRSPDGLCGTKGCVAGWAGVLGSPPGTVIEVLHGEACSVYLNYPDGQLDYIATAAQRLLDLDDDQAGWLFSSVLSREQVLSGLNALIQDPRTDFGGDEWLCA